MRLCKGWIGVPLAVHIVLLGRSCHKPARAAYTACLLRETTPYLLLTTTMSINSTRSTLNGRLTDDALYQLVYLHGIVIVANTFVRWRSYCLRVA